MSILRVSLSLIFLASIATVAVTQPQGKMPTAEEITKSWGTLSDKYTSLKMTWKQKAHYTGHIGNSIRESVKIQHDIVTKRGGKPEPTIFNENEYRHENHFSFLWSKGAWRLEKRGLMVAFNRPDPIPDHWTLVFDRKETTSLRLPSTIPQHQAQIRNPRHCTEFDRSCFRQVGNLLLGANDENVGALDLDDFQFSAGQPIQGMKTIQAKKTDTETNSVTTYVFIPSLDFAVAEHSYERKGIHLSRYKAEFDLKSRVPSVPKIWTYEVHMDGKLSSAYTNTLESLSLNAPVPDSAFKLTFPPGTLVIDRRIDQKPVRYTVPDAKPPEKK